MTPDEHRKQRERALGSLVETEDGRACLHNAYAKHPLARAVPRGRPSVASIAASIRELGEMLDAADRLPDFNESMVELERLADRLGAQLGSLRDVVCHAFLEAAGIEVATEQGTLPRHGRNGSGEDCRRPLGGDLGVPPAGQRPVHGGYPDDVEVFIKPSIHFDDPEPAT